MPLIRSTYLGMISGLVLSLALSHSVWLEMRINTSLVLPLCLAAGVWNGLYLKKVPQTVLVMLVQGILAVALLYAYGPDIGAWTVIPAALIREGLLLKFVDLSGINLMLVCLILLGNAALLPFHRFFKKAGSL